MSVPPEHLVTRLLDRVNEGDDTATSELLNVAYRDLRALAAVVFSSESPGHTLQPTAVVNEVCLRLLKSNPGPNGWTDRNHFFRTAARAMRNVLTDHARAKNALRRSDRAGGSGGGSRGSGGSGGSGDGGQRVSLDSIQVASDSGGVNLIALNEIIEKLAAYDARLGSIFELRFLAGLSVEQTALVSDSSPRTIERDCQFIRAWLRRELYS